MAQHASEATYHPLPAEVVDRPPEYEDVEDTAEMDELQEEIHLATVEEKKRRWWRNAAINVAFIGSWCVCLHSERLLH